MSLLPDHTTSASDFRYTFTVFTPSYNRAGLLPRAYESLKQQTFKDFEWLIIDDGSTDNTREVVEAWQVGAPFPIRYVAQPNRGKHTAVNRGAKEAHGRFFANLDSDDWYVPRALERFMHHWNQIPAAAQAKFAGVVALVSHPSGEVIGTRFPKDVFDSDPIELRYRHKVQGDKNGILRTDVMRQFPFPEDVGKFIPESIVWNRMAKSYQTRFVNEVLMVADYQQTGLSATGHVLQVQNARASLLASQELIGLGTRLPLLARVRAYSNYVRHSLHERVPVSTILSHAPSKMMLCLCGPIGAFLKSRDARRLREHA